MRPDFIERRRRPRVSSEGGAILALHVSVPVRVLDLSSDGLLVATDVPLREGSTVRVAAELAGHRLDVELCIRHVSARRGDAAGGYVAGGSFPSYDQRARRTIAALLHASGLGDAAAPPLHLESDRRNAPARSGAWRDRRIPRPERPQPRPASWMPTAP